MQTFIASATVVAAILSVVSATPLQRRTESVSIVFHGAIAQGSEQTLSLSWPVDGQEHAFSDIANETGDQPQLSNLSFSTGYIANDGTDATCTFTGTDGLQLPVTNEDVETGSTEPFTVGPPQVIVSGICS